MDLTSLSYDHAWGLYEAWLQSLPVSDDIRVLVTRSIGLAILALLTFAITLLARVFFRRLYRHRNDSEFRRLLWKKHVLDRKPRIVPGIVAALLAPLIFMRDPWMCDVVQFFAGIYLTVLFLIIAHRLLNVVYALYEEEERAGHVAVKAFIQAGKLIVYVISLVVLVSIAFGQSPLLILSGLGAATAVVLFIFKDSLLGLVAGVQLNVNDMIRIGDWIQMTNHDANGYVTDITLTTIKVENFDRTISLVPSYALISETFINWRGMYDAGGRRIKRALCLDMRSIRFADHDLLDQLGKIHLMRDHVEQSKAIIKAYNSEHQIPDDDLASGRHLTNAGLFRIYCEKYLTAHPYIHDEPEFTFLVRHLKPTPNGLPIELYVFTQTTDWNKYEAIQADIFDHLIAALHYFDLRVYQAPSGEDMERVGFQTTARNANASERLS